MEHRFEGLTAQQLHRDEDVPAVAVEIKHSRDIRMRERLPFARLALKRNEGIGVSLETRVEYFDGHLGVWIARLEFAAVFGAEHRAHAAAANQGFDLKSGFENRARA